MVLSIFRLSSPVPFHRAENNKQITKFITLAKLAL